VAQRTSTPTRPRSSQKDRLNHILAQALGGSLQGFLVYNRISAANRKLAIASRTSVLIAAIEGDREMALTNSNKTLFKDRGFKNI
jgi:hypothetical protein